VTERCVFRLTPQGLELTEVAPGIDIERDILAHMDFAPIVGKPRVMDPLIFGSEPMGLRETLLSIRLPDRFTYDADRETFFMNFEGLKVRTEEQMDEIYRHIEERLTAIGKKVSVVVNADGMELAEDLTDRYAQHAQSLAQRFYRNVTRYTTSAFMRSKLADSLAARGAQPHLFETQREAMDFAQKWQATETVAP